MFSTQKIDKLTTMVTELTAHNNNEAKPFKDEIYLGKGEVKAEIIIMGEVYSKIEICQIAETDLEDHHTEADLSLDQISEEETDEILESTTHMTGVKVGQGTGTFKEILGEMTEVAVGQDQFEDKYQ